jgi:hypothetical protein
MLIPNLMLLEVLFLFYLPAPGTIQTYARGDSRLQGYENPHFQLWGFTLQ